MFYRSGLQAVAKKLAHIRVIRGSRFYLWTFSTASITRFSEAFWTKNRFNRAEITGQAEWAAIKKHTAPFDIITMNPEEFDNGGSIIADHAKQGKIVIVA